ncbi:MAG: BadF/BadG/BcrA/BcrD ATPase family protein [Candidatus Latescibacterota bacterium]
MRAKGADARYVMGFDVGGTKTACVLMDEQGHCLGKGFGGSGNTNFIPLEIATQSFTDAIEEARRQAGLEALAVQCVVVGTEPDPKPVAPLIRRLTGTRRILHRKEGECSMVGGLVSKVGLSLICGTGSVGWGRNEKGETSMTSCWGPIGDEGSAYDIARRGVNAAFWAWDGRGKKTVLVDMLLRMFRKKDLRDVCTPLYTSPNLRKDFASLARLVTEAADQGDAVARQVLRDGAVQIAHFLATCADNLGMGKTGYRVASANSGLVTGSNYRYFKMIRQELRKVHPKAELVKPRFEPVIGAGLIALDEIGVEWTPAVVRNIEESC